MATIKDSVFAKLALSAQFVTEEQLQECREIQKEREKSGQAPAKLVDLLCEKGYLSPTQFNSLMEGFEQKQRRLFGEIALKWNLVTADQIEECLNMQKGMKRGGSKAPRIGQIMVSKNYLKAHQVKAILEEQNKKIAKCKHCGAQFNVRQFTSNKKLKCGQCGKLLSLLEEEESAIDVASTLETPKPSQDQKKSSPKLNIPNYKIFKRLGEDSTGIIYKARNIQSKEVVTLKVLNSEICEDKEFMESLEKGIKVAGEVKHANIKQTFGIEKNESVTAVVSEFIEGESLRNILLRESKIPVDKSLKIAVRVAKALKFAHEHGVLHGDIRPSNILISREGKVVISGVGLTTKVTENVLNIVNSGQLAPFYLAPEYVLEDRTPDHRSDIYSLGATLYHIIAGRPPFEGQSPFEVLVRFSEDYFPPLQIYSPDVPLGVCKIVEKMLNAEPNDRYQDYDTLINDLENPDSVGKNKTYAIPAVSTEELEVEKESRDKSLGELATKYEFPMGYTLIGVIGVLLVAVGIFYNYFLKSKTQSEDKLFNELRSFANTNQNNFLKIPEIRHRLKKFIEEYPTHKNAKEAERMLLNLPKQEEKLIRDAFALVSQKAEEAIKEYRFGDALAEIEKFPQEYRNDNGVAMMLEEQERIMEKCRKSYDEFIKIDEKSEKRDFAKELERLQIILKKFAAENMMNEEINKMVENAKKKIKEVKEIQEKVKASEEAKQKEKSRQRAEECVNQLLTWESNFEFKKALDQGKRWLEDKEDGPKYADDQELIREKISVLERELNLHNIILNEKNNVKDFVIHLKNESCRVLQIRPELIVIGRKTEPNQKEAQENILWKNLPPNLYYIIAEAVLEKSKNRATGLISLGVFCMQKGLIIQAYQTFKKCDPSPETTSYLKELENKCRVDINKKIQEIKELSGKGEFEKALQTLISIKELYNETGILEQIPEINNIFESLCKDYFGSTDGNKSIYLPFDKKEELSDWKTILLKYQIEGGIFNISRGSGRFTKNLKDVTGIQGFLLFPSPADNLFKITFGDYNFQIKSTGEVSIYNYRLNYFPNKNLDIPIQKWIPFRFYIKDNIAYWSLNFVELGSVKNLPASSRDNIYLEIRGDLKLEMLYITYFEK